MNTDTGRIYTSEEMADYEKLMKSIPEQSNFRLSDYVQKHKPDPKKMAEEILKADQENKILKMKIPPTLQQLKQNPPRVGRNDPCPCSSGKKFEKCHWTGRKV